MDHHVAEVNDVPAVVVDNEKQSPPLLTIGIRGTGPGSGKDTSAKLISILLSKKEINTSIQKFATPIRLNVEAQTGISVSVTETVEGKNLPLPQFLLEFKEYIQLCSLCTKEEIGEAALADESGFCTSNFKMSVGRYLQILGSCVKKTTNNPNYWIDTLFSGFTQGEVVIISDVRFPNEQKAIKNRNGITILVNSSRMVSDTCMAGRDAEHETETALKDIPADYVIENDGTIDELKKKLSSLIDKLFQ